MSLLLLLSESVGSSVSTTAPLGLHAQAEVSPLPLSNTYFMDETGVNPLPPGVQISIYAAGAAFTPDNLLYSGYSQLGGLLAFTPRSAVSYTAVFSGTLGPETPQSFIGTSVPGQATIVSVSGYRAPFLSQLGYVQEQFQIWPPGRFGETALQPGGVAYALAYMFAYLLAYYDIESQQNLSASRLQTCIAAQIDSWAYDFFGSYLLRFPSEPDAVYLSRILTMFGPRCTIPAIQKVVQQFYVATAQQTQQQLQQNLGYETAGGFDSRGGFDTFVESIPIAQLIPNVSVWDAQSNPTLAMQYNVCPPQFVVQIGLDQSAAWFLDNSALDYDTFLTNDGAVVVSQTPPDPRLGALVDLVKATGTEVLWAVST